MSNTETPVLQPSPIQLPRPSILFPVERLSSRFVLSGHAEVHVCVFNGEGGCGMGAHLIGIVPNRETSRIYWVQVAWEIAEHHDGDPTKGMMGLTGL